MSWKIGLSYLPFTLRMSEPMSWGENLMSDGTCLSSGEAILDG
jgi:hypothetical protein